MADNTEISLHPGRESLSPTHKTPGSSSGRAKTKAKRASSAQPVGQPQLSLSEVTAQLFEIQSQFNQPSQYYPQNQWYGPPPTPASMPPPGGRGYQCQWQGYRPQFQPGPYQDPWNPHQAQYPMYPQQQPSMGQGYNTQAWVDSNPPPVQRHGQFDRSRTSAPAAISRIDQVAPLVLDTASKKGQPLSLGFCFSSISTTGTIGGQHAYHWLT
jgi:hypothetical protein